MVGCYDQPPRVMTASQQRLLHPVLAGALKSDKRESSLQWTEIADQERYTNTVLLQPVCPPITELMLSTAHVHCRPKLTSAILTNKGMHTQATACGMSQFNGGHACSSSRTCKQMRQVGSANATAECDNPCSVLLRSSGTRGSTCRGGMPTDAAMPHHWVVVPYYSDCAQQQCHEGLIKLQIYVVYQ
jgi:hypothetical protein